MSGPNPYKMVFGGGPVEDDDILKVEPSSVALKPP